MSRLLKWFGAFAATVLAAYAVLMIAFTADQRTVGAARFMASYSNSAPQIVIGVLAEYTLPYLHSAGVIHPMDLEIDRGIRMHLDARDLVPRHIIANGVYEPVTTRIIEEHLPSGGAFIDVGAHIGFHSLKAAKKVGHAGRVLAVEPNPDTLAELERNLKGSDAPQVRIQPVACSDKESTLELFAGSLANTGMSSLSRQTAEAEGKSERNFKVRARPLDDIVLENGLDRVDVLKIDVEGAEMFVLKGARQTLQKFHPYLVMEVKEEQLVAMHTSTAELLSFLAGMGYQPGRSFEGNMEFVYRPAAASRH